MDVRLQSLLLEGEALTASGTYAQRVNGGEVMWSPGMYQLTGFDPAQGPNLEQYLACIHPLDVDALRADWMASYADGRERQMRFRFKPLNGALKWFESQWRFTCDSQGRPEVCYGAVRDITDKVILEENLLEGERLARSGCFRITPPDFALFWSSGIYRLTGLEPSELPSMDRLMNIIHAEYRQELIQLLETSQRVPGEYQHEHRLMTPQGEIWVRARWVSLAGADGQPELTFGSVQDISQEREMAALARQAEAANQAKNRFLASISHEIRTPLTAVVGMSQLLMMDSGLSEDKRQDFLKIVHDSGRAMHHIINDVLDLTQIEAGKMRIERKVIDLNELLANLNTSYSALCQGKHLTFSLLSSADVPHKVYADGLRLRQILLNFLGNALKFTQHGGITLQVAREDARLVFSVLDTGIGIAAEHTSHLFQPFAQADDSIAQQFGGTGLGLSICRELAQLMGGEVGVRSTLGSGSRFWLALPLASLALPTVGARPAQALADLSGVRVLVVDDNNVNALLAVRVLNHVGAQVESVNSGQGALDRIGAVDEGRFDLVLMDIQMPGMDGLEATRRLRLAGHRLPIVAMTAHVMTDMEDAALTAGMNDVVGKPFEVPDFIQTVARHTGRWGQV